MRPNICSLILLIGSLAHKLVRRSHHLVLVMNFCDRGSHVLVTIWIDARGLFINPLQLFHGWRLRSTSFLVNCRLFRNGLWGFLALSLWQTRWLWQCSNFPFFLRNILIYTLKRRIACACDWWAKTGHSGRLPLWTILVRVRKSPWRPSWRPSKLVWNGHHFQVTSSWNNGWIIVY